jgi:predicted nucleic acid-binding protein
MLLDTSGLLCYFDRSEIRHGDAVTLFQAAPSRFTHSYVLAELIALCQVRGLNRARALAFAADLIDNPEVDVVWVDEYLHRAALAFLQARSDKTYSLCDAVSFLLMKSWGIDEALTTDRHFQQAGFIRLLPA